MALEPLATDSVAVSDGYRSLAELFGFTQGQPVRFVEGEVQFETAAVRYRRQRTKPNDADSGVRVSAGASRLFGPNSPCRLDYFWVKEDVAAGGATVVATGEVEVTHASR